MLVKNRRLSDSSSTAIVLYSCSVVDSAGLHRTSREKANPGGSWTFCVSHGSTACLRATDLERDRVSRNRRSRRAAARGGSSGSAAGVQIGRASCRGSGEMCVDEAVEG